jgi:C-terminal processing protease CtpA/Prc
LRGKPDTDVRLTVLHQDTKETGSVTIRRFAVAGKN